MIYTYFTATDRQYNKEISIVMISYAPFWETLKRSEESTYTLIKHYGISGSTINRLRKNKPLNTTTVNDLCRALKCGTGDIMAYIPSDEDQFL